MSTRNWISFTFLLLLCACYQNKNVASFPSLPGYDLANPIIVHLKTDLDEISGVQFYEKDTSIFAINDEMGLLYKIYVRKQVKVMKWKFSSEGDYEDIVVRDSTFYTLQSNGNLKIFKFLQNDLLSIESCQLPIMGQNDFETLFYDDKSEKLVLICKTCAGEKKNRITAWSFNPADNTFSDQPYFTINTDFIARQLDKGTQKFKPSAAAIHPITNDLYLISSVAKALVIADRDGKVKEAYQLNPALFKQPEGMTFTPAGDLIISNESADIGAPNILLFKYKKAVHEKG